MQANCNHLNIIIQKVIWKTGCWNMAVPLPYVMNTGAPLTSKASERTYHNQGSHIRTTFALNRQPSWAYRVSSTWSSNYPILKNWNFTQARPALGTSPASLQEGAKVMAGIHHPTRGGSRGGGDQFEWDDVKVDKYRENYLGKWLCAHNLTEAVSWKLKL